MTPVHCSDTVTSEPRKDDDMLRQMRSMYAQTNKLLNTFEHCVVDVKIALFNNYCASLYCSFLWNDFQKSTLNLIRVAFNNAY